MTRFTATGITAFVQADLTNLFNNSPYVWDVVPSLLAWLALLLAVLLCLCYAIDRSTYADFRVRHWLTLRLQLTLLAAAGLTP